MALLACTAPAAPIVVRPTAPAGFADPARAEKLATAFPALDQLLEAQRTEQHIPGLAFGVVVDGTLVYQRGLGVLDLARPATVDADTVFRIGSITKTFTSLALLQLRDRGRLALDDALVRWLPELAPIQYPTRDAAPFTIRQALTHTSGLPPVGNYSTTRSDHAPTEAEMLSGLGTLALASPPGTRFAYSNFAMSLLGLVIERASGVRYRDWVNREILAPLGMHASYWDPEAVPAAQLATPYAKGPTGPRPVARWQLGAAESAGGLYSTLRDLSRYAAFQLSAYPPRDEADAGPLRRSSLREAHAIQYATDLVVADGAVRADGIGLGWWGYRSCELEQVVWHPGGTEGYRGTIHLLPEHGVALILLTNYVDTDYDKIVDPALAILRGSGGLAPRTRPVSPAMTRAIAGVIELYAGFTDARYHALFSPQMRDAVPASAIVELQTSLRAEHGACTTPTPIAVDGPLAARFAVGCERGHLEYTVTLGDRGEIVAASVTSHAEPTAAPVGGCVRHTVM